MLGRNLWVFKYQLLVARVVNGCERCIMVKLTWHICEVLLDARGEDVEAFSSLTCRCHILLVLLLGFLSSPPISLLAHSFHGIEQSNTIALHVRVCICVRTSVWVSQKQRFQKVLGRFFAGQMISWNRAFLVNILSAAKPTWQLKVDHWNISDSAQAILHNPGIPRISKTKPLIFTFLY